MIEITRKVEFDAGHRIPDHQSKCCNIHGHRYVVEATLCGEVVGESGRPDTGMVLDFGDLKDAMNKAVGEAWDHALLVYSGDTELMAAVKCMPRDHKTIVLTVVPTVENLVIIAAMRIKHFLGMARANGSLVHVRMYETPNCWADWYGTSEEN